MLKKSLFFLNLFFSVIFCKIDFDKVIIWGHKLHSHTHSFIHYGFFKAFNNLGYKTYWLDNNDDITNFNFENSLFITEGQVDQKIPLSDNCFYILHNCNITKYQRLYDTNKCLLLQVYTNDCLKYKFEKIEDYIYINKQSKIICMPWATDLLPDEINEVKKSLNLSKNQNAVFIGTKGGGQFGNENEINGFAKACAENNIPFNIYNNFKRSFKENLELIKNSYMAPAIQGHWQCENGYIPCRIFKNISYGQMGITNSETVYNLFNKKIVFDKNCYDLFYKAKKKLDEIKIEEIYELMDFVKEKHTYLNRINTLLNFINQIVRNPSTSSGRTDKQ